MVHTNLEVAQHRDSLRYARLRSGSYLPKILEFHVGDFVYLRDLADPLHPTARPEILRIKDVRPSGVLVLEGQCGNTIARNGTHCAPCHLPIELPSVVDETRPAACAGCEKCHMSTDDNVMLTCDSCNRCWHTYCLDPPLTRVPRGDWLCSECVKSGVNLTTLRTARAELYHVRSQRQAPQRAGRITGKNTRPPIVQPVAPRLPETLWATTARPNPNTAKKTASTQKLHSLAVVSALDTVPVCDWRNASSIWELRTYLMPGNWPASDFAIDLKHQAALSPTCIPDSGLSLFIPTWATHALVSFTRELVFLCIANFCGPLP